MSSNPRPSIPKSASEYGDYRWHLRWTVSLEQRKLVHASGLTFVFQVSDGQVIQMPNGGHCPSGVWFGQIDTRSPLPAKPPKQHEAIRLCLEALQLWGDLAMFVCLDCSRNTMGDHYYMVHNLVWLQAHPKNHGMLCLDCLSDRLKRDLRPKDFIECAVNYWSPLVLAIREH